MLHTIVNGVLDSTKAISNSILDLRYSVTILAFDENGQRMGIFTFFDESKFIFSQNMLVH